MILKKEIERIAQQKGVARTTIDKDWVLSHFIDAIFSIPECRKNLIFKGGTSLRKCYFEDYRSTMVASQKIWISQLLMKVSDWLQSFLTR
ncbi:nucleotidyl transferase AbiEii/AbiGii toxin family protein [Catalinimonas sp. 4WD22]|uniref:nucleotidyl transferase AbiEii/AbiGii toxin family protein n=1 Tax=Catalinimonas locisalis TaxID=3133978 RepID=UPI003100BC42